MSDIESLNIEKMSFEEAYEKLNEIVNKMENSDVSLEESIKYYETGILLKNHCENKSILKSLSQKVYSTLRY